MVSFIVLSPLHDGAALNSQTSVNVFHGAQALASTLGAALVQFPKAAVALHPVDAPAHAIALPPLPANRRDAALRVKLEDLLLGETSQLTLAVHATAKNSFWVSCTATIVLNKVLASLNALGHPKREVVALANSLPAHSELTLGQWTLWRDAQGAGAMPTPANSNAGALRAVDLNKATAPFTATQVKGAAWQRWRWALLLAVLCGLVYLIGLFIHSRQLLALEQQANRGIAAAFQAALPNTPMVDPVLQLQRASKGGNALTTALGNIPADWPQGMVTQMTWANKRLAITANASAMKLTDAQKKTLLDALAAKNITVTWSKP